MDSASKQLQSEFNADDLAKLKSVVRGKASGDLSEADVDDISGEILLSACVTASKTNSTAPVAALAFNYAAMPSYYVKARKVAATTAYDGPTLPDGGEPIASDPILSIEIRDVLRSLSEERREMIWRCDVEGRTLAETATAFGVSIATAHRRLKGAHDDFRAAWTA